MPFAGDASSTLVTALLDGTQGQTVRVFSCDEPDQCLNPTLGRFSPATCVFFPKNLFGPGLVQYLPNGFDSVTSHLGNLAVRQPS